MNSMSSRQASYPFSLAHLKSDIRSSLIRRRRKRNLQDISRNKSLCKPNNPAYPRSAQSAWSKRRKATDWRQISQILEVSFEHRHSKTDDHKNVKKLKDATVSKISKISDRKSYNSQSRPNEDAKCPRTLPKANTAYGFSKRGNIGERTQETQNQKNNAQFGFRTREERRVFAKVKANLDLKIPTTNFTQTINVSKYIRSKARYEEAEPASRLENKSEYFSSSLRRGPRNSFSSFRNKSNRKFSKSMRIDPDIGRLEKEEILGYSGPGSYTHIDRFPRRSLNTGTRNRDTGVETQMNKEISTRTRKTEAIETAVKGYPQPDRRVSKSIEKLRSLRESLVKRRKEREFKYNFKNSENSQTANLKNVYASPVRENVNKENHNFFKMFKKRQRTDNLKEASYKNLEHLVKERAHTHANPVSKIPEILTYIAPKQETPFKTKLFSFQDPLDSRSKPSARVGSLAYKEILKSTNFDNVPEPDQKKRRASVNNRFSKMFDRLNEDISLRRKNDKNDSQDQICQKSKNLQGQSRKQNLDFKFEDSEDHKPQSSTNFNFSKKEIFESLKASKPHTQFQGQNQGKSLSKRIDPSSLINAENLTFGNILSEEFSESLKRKCQAPFNNSSASQKGQTTKPLRGKGIGNFVKGRKRASFLLRTSIDRKANKETGTHVNKAETQDPVKLSFQSLVRHRPETMIKPTSNISQNRLNPRKLMSLPSKFGGFENFDNAIPESALMRKFPLSKVHELKIFFEGATSDQIEKLPERFVQF